MKFNIRKMFNGAVCVTVITMWMVQEKAIKIFVGHNETIKDQCCTAAHIRHYTKYMRISASDNVKKRSKSEIPPCSTKTAGHL